MRSRHRSPLFAAVVLAGASLTSAGACGGEAEPTAEGDASTADGGKDAKSPFTPADASRDAADAGSCPDGSDQATPPCVLIK